MAYDSKPLPFSKSLTGISDKTIQIHHDKLYQGYVSKMNEITTRLTEMNQSGDGLADANQTYSELRALRDGETFATNGVYLHEYYFNSLGGGGNASGELVKAIEEKWGSMEKFLNYFNASAMAVRGWVVLAWDAQKSRLKVYGADAHNQGGVWGCMPLIVLDVYEHAYFMDYGADRKAYIEDFWKNLNWDAANNIFEKVKDIKLN